MKKSTSGTNAQSPLSTSPTSASKKFNSVNVNLTGPSHNKQVSSSAPTVKTTNQGYGRMVVLGATSKSKTKSAIKAPKLSVPVPVDLPSLKSEHSGADTPTNVVTSGSSGWGKHAQSDSQQLSTSPPATSNTQTTQNLDSFRKETNNVWSVPQINPNTKLISEPESAKEEFSGIKQNLDIEKRGHKSTVERNASNNRYEDDRQRDSTRSSDHERRERTEYERRNNDVQSRRSYNTSNRIYDRDRERERDYEFEPKPPSSYQTSSKSQPHSSLSLHDPRHSYQREERAKGVDHGKQPEPNVKSSLKDNWADSNLDEQMDYSKPLIFEDVLKDQRTQLLRDKGEAFKETSNLNQEVSKSATKQHQSTLPHSNRYSSQVEHKREMRNEPPNGNKQHRPQSTLQPSEKQVKQITILTRDSSQHPSFLAPSLINKPPSATLMQEAEKQQQLPATRTTLVVEEEPSVSLTDQKEYMRKLAQAKAEEKRIEEEKRNQEQIARALAKKLELEKRMAERINQEQVSQLKKPEKPELPIPPVKESETEVTTTRSSTFTGRGRGRGTRAAIVRPQRSSDIRRLKFSPKVQHTYVLKSLPKETEKEQTSQIITPKPFTGGNEEMKAEQLPAPETTNSTIISSTVSTHQRAEQSIRGRGRGRARGRGMIFTPTTKYVPKEANLQSPVTDAIQPTNESVVETPRERISPTLTRFSNRGRGTLHQKGSIFNRRGRPSQLIYVPKSKPKEEDEESQTSEESYEEPVQTSKKASTEAFIAPIQSGVVVIPDEQPGIDHEDAENGEFIEIKSKRKERLERIKEKAAKEALLAKLAKRKTKLKPRAVPTTATIKPESTPVAVPVAPKQTVTESIKPVVMPTPKNEPAWNKPPTVAPISLTQIQLEESMRSTIQPENLQETLKQSDIGQPTKPTKVINKERSTKTVYKVKSQETPTEQPKSLNEPSIIPQPLQHPEPKTFDFVEKGSLADQTKNQLKNNKRPPSAEIAISKPNITSAADTPSVLKHEAPLPYLPLQQRAVSAGSTPTTSLPIRSVPEARRTFINSDIFPEMIPGHQPALWTHTATTVDGTAFFASPQLPVSVGSGYTIFPAMYYPFTPFPPVGMPPFNNPAFIQSSPQIISSPHQGSPASHITHMVRSMEPVELGFPVQTKYDNSPMNMATSPAVTSSSTQSARPATEPPTIPLAEYQQTMRAKQSQSQPKSHETPPYKGGNSRSYQSNTQGNKNANQRWAPRDRSATPPPVEQKPVAPQREHSSSYHKRTSSGSSNSLHRTGSKTLMYVPKDTISSNKEQI